MDRVKYIQMRKSGQYDLAWFYELYLQEKKKEWPTYDFNSFMQNFNMYFQFNGRAVLEYTDKKMGVSKIENEQGNLLYID
jgi:hypothetical protein